MASILENFKSYDKLSTNKMFGIFELIDQGILLETDKWYIEIVLFLELYIYFQGVPLTDQTRDYFTLMLKRINSTLDKNDNVSLRSVQCEEILKVYEKHYNILENDRLGLLKTYLLIAYINRIELSFKNNYITNLFNIDVSAANLNNLKFKQKIFQNGLDNLFNALDNINKHSFDDINIATQYEIVKTIIKLQFNRGFNEEEYE